jgi:hypothetical protein
VPNFPTPISPKAAILTRRHITNEQADILKVGPMGIDEVVGHLGYRPKGAISYIEALPYWDAEGHELGEPQFFRFRFNYTAGWEPPEGDWKEYPKYRSPRRKGEFAYLPRGVGMDWTAIYGEPAVPLIITEGEYKSIRVCSAWDQPCIGLGGVWMFHATKVGWPLGMEMTLTGREVYIAFDADVESTHEHPLKGGSRGVDGAAHRLANKLYQASAVPWIVYIARTETFLKARTKDINAKMGIDDFIDAGGTWNELLATRENPIEHAGLAYLFDKYAFYRGSVTGVVEVSTGVFYRVNDWFNVEANCIGTSLVEKGGKLVPIKVRFPQMYMEHAERPEFSNYIFEPSLGFGLDQESGTFNRWRGMAVNGWVGPGEQVAYQEIVALWKAFITRLCGSGADYFERWVADLFQNPGRKTTIAVLLRSTLNGVGKSLLGEILRDIVGTHHSARIGLQDVVHHFNSLVGDRVLIQVDEANDFRKEYDAALKNMVTADECVVTLKGRDSIILKNYARLFITSNAVSPIVLDEHNRRFFVMEPTLTMADEKGEWAKWVGSTVAKMLRSPEGLRMLRWYFDTMDIGAWEPTAHTPKTEAMMDVVAVSSSKNNELVEHLWREFQAGEAGIWVVGGRLMANQESKVLWGRFKDNIKISGGQWLTHVMKLPGETGTKRVTIFVRWDTKKLPVRHVDDQGWTLEAGMNMNETLVKSMTLAEKAYAAWAGILPSNKY